VLGTSFAYPSRIKRAIDTLSAEKVIFGSDAPFGCQEIALKAIKVLRLPEDQERLVLGENIARIVAKVPKY